MLRKPPVRRPSPCEVEGMVLLDEHNDEQLVDENNEGRKPRLQGRFHDPFQCDTFAAGGERNGAQGGFVDISDAAEGGESQASFAGADFR